MTEDTHRQVTIERITNSHYTVTNARGGTITVGTADSTDFSPVELLLTAIGACTAIDVDILTSRRAEPDSFAIAVDAEKLRDDKARALLPDAVKRSHDQLCTVSRTVELGTPVATRID
jgi:putative redox protein